jgi:GNAT superfamily N-acetyltransferase
MVKELLPVAVDPNSAGADFWARYHAFRRERHLETRPDDPIVPDVVEERTMRHDMPFEIHYRYEISSGDEMRSWFAASTAKPGAPGYEENRHLFDAWAEVRRDQRRKEIGRSWLPLVLELMDRHGCTVLNLSSDEQSGHAFLRWLGAEEKSRGAENRLRMAGVDWAMVRRWIEEGQVRSPKTTLEIYDDHIPESLIEDFAPQLGRLLNTIPFDALDHGDIVITPEVVRFWNEHMDLADEVHHVVLAREPDGVISGMTDVSWSPHIRTIVEQLFTGVRPDARGRGIGKWIKAVMLDRVHRLHPDAEWVSTGNAASNGPMLAINQKLGFGQHRAGADYQMTRDQLAERIKRA